MNSTELNRLYQLIENELLSKGYSIHVVSRSTMETRIDEIMELVNSVRNEYAKEYHWTPEAKEYYLKDLSEKWDLSMMITHQEKIVFVNISSMQNNAIHFHGSYTRDGYRGRNLATLHMALISIKTLKAGLEEMEGYWPKRNNGSLILHLRLGWMIDDLRKNGEQLFLKCNARNTLELSLKHLKLNV